MQQQDSFYSSDQQFFLDICRGGQLQQIQQFLNNMQENSQFDWKWTTNNKDNFIHMIAANNLFEVFDKVIDSIRQKIKDKQIFNQIVNQKNSSGNTPLHYAVINGGKQMVERLLKSGADPNIQNQFKRTSLNEAQDFGKQQIAEMLAPVTKVDIQQLKKFTEGLKLNDDSSDSDQQQQQQQKKQKQKSLQKIEEEESQQTLNQNKNNIKS